MPKVPFDPKNPRASFPTDWPSFVKRYVWNSEKTPYFVKVENLTQPQAASELKLWGLFVFIAGFVLAFALLVGRIPPGPSAFAGSWAFVVSLAALTLLMLRSPAAAIICASGPVGLALKAITSGISAQPSLMNTLFFVTLMGAFAYYGYRAFRICQAFDNLPPER